ncbi:hypothetical protein SNE40_014060 [Patella caerulea]
MNSPTFKTISTSYFMMTLAVNDAMSLCISLTAHWLHVNFPETIVRTQYSYIMCRFFDSYGWGNCDFAIIIVAAMTADRSYAILYPLKCHTKRTPRRLRIEIALLVLVIVVKDIHFWFVSDIVPLGRDERLCEVPVLKLTSRYRYFYEDIWPWIHITFISCCFVVIFVSNIVIIFSVKKSSSNKSVVDGRKQRTGSSKNKRISPRSAQLRQIAVMLLCSSCVQLLLTFPFSVHIAIADKMAELTCNPNQQSINGFVFSATFYMLYSNKCVNFIIFTCSGTRFRKTWQNKLSQYICRRKFKSLQINHSTKNPISAISYPTVSSEILESTKL